VLDRAAAAVHIVRRRTTRPVMSAGGCRALGVGCQVNLGTGNLAVQAGPPGGGNAASNPVLTYNSQVSGSAGLPNGWNTTFTRFVVLAGSFQLTVHTGDGKAYQYNANMQTNGYYPVLSGNPSPNSLYSPTHLSGPFTETRPDGWQFYYTGVSPWNLESIRNPSGSRWTVSYDGSGRVKRVTDPFSRLTTFAYDATSTKIKRIQDAGGRITSITVNAAGNLARITSPELCITSLIYDSSNRPTAWINPLGDRTSYAYDSSSRVTKVVLPLGQRSTLSYLSGNKTVLTDPRG
jgi:YD repeat-containing protein